MAVCIRKDSAEYQILRNRSGISEFILDSVCRDFLERYGRFPYLDELPNSNSESSLKERFHIKENGAVVISNVLESTGKETIEEAVVSINDEYRDLEVTMIPIVKEAIVDVTHRPTDNNFTPEEIERSNILENAQRNEFGQLLAPNGEVSNLTEEQYVQVRTKAFKRWFGDWETANKFNFRAIDRSKVDVIPMNKSWKDNPTKFNKTIRIYLKGLHEKGYFELVKDDEFATYSVHFVTATEQTGPLTSSRGEHAIPSTYNERLILWELLLNAIPDGAMISTHGNLSEDGIRALNKLGKKGRFTKIGEREVSKKGTNKKVNIPIWQKGNPTSKVVDENGEPLVVYHGSPTPNISTFEKGIFGSNNYDINNQLFYFTENRKMAETYTNEYFGDYAEEVPNIGFEEASRLYEHNVRIRTTAVFLNIKNPTYLNPDLITKNDRRYLNSGSDGAISTESIMDDASKYGNSWEEGFQYAAIYRNQIKSATNNTGEYSRFNNNIHDEEVNDFIVLNNALEKLASLYGITFNDITDAELQTEQWRNIMPEGSSVNAFIYNGLVYINLDRAKVDAPLHEMMHMFVGSIRFTNPKLYSELVQSTESFPNYELLLSQYPGRTRNDVNEEILVTEIAKYLTGLPSNLSGIDERIRYEILYNIKRVLDTILMGKDSVKTISEDRLFDMSLHDISKMIQSIVMDNNFSGTMNVENSELHRKLNNIKSDLYKNGTLEEYCE